MERIACHFWVARSERAHEESCCSRSRSPHCCQDFRRGPCQGAGIPHPRQGWSRRAGAVPPTRAAHGSIAHPIKYPLWIAAGFATAMGFMAKSRASTRNGKALSLLFRQAKHSPDLTSWSKVLDNRKGRCCVIVTGGKGTGGREQTQTSPTKPSDDFHSLNGRILANTAEKQLHNNAIPQRNAKSTIL